MAALLSLDRYGRTRDRILLRYVNLRTEIFGLDSVKESETLEPSTHQLRERTRRRISK
jgi:hypothetical protein